MTDPTNQITVEDVRKLALPLGTRVVSGDGLLNRVVSWTTVIYMDDNLASKSIQANEMILVAPPENNTRPGNTDVDIVRWAADVKASSIVFSHNISPNALAESKAYGIPVLALPAGNRPRV